MGEGESKAPFFRRIATSAPPSAATAPTRTDIATFALISPPGLGHPLPLQPMCAMPCSTVPPSGWWAPISCRNFPPSSMTSGSPRLTTLNPLFSPWPSLLTPAPLSPSPALIATHGFAPSRPWRRPTLAPCMRPSPPLLPRHDSAAVSPRVCLALWSPPPPPRCLCGPAVWATDPLSSLPPRAPPRRQGVGRFRDRSPSLVGVVRW